MAEKMTTARRTLARPYADAAFQLALEENALEAWSVALERMAAIAMHADVQVCVNDPKFLSDELAIEQQNFVALLVKNKRLDVLSEIYDLFLGLRNAHECIQEAHITSAFPLDDKLLNQLVTELESRFKRKIQATVNVDSALIGGVKVAVGDQVIDASVRGKLAAMAVALKN
jgi:F-type H+-transporting ATPase subunit delta